MTDMFAISRCECTQIKSSKKCFKKMKKYLCLSETKYLVSFFAFKCSIRNWCQFHCILCEKKYIGSSADDLKGLSGPRSLHFLIVTYDALFQKDNIKMMKVVLELSDLRSLCFCKIISEVC